MTQVTAKRYGWDQARANNKLAEPDPAVPLLDVADMVTGTLTKQDETVHFGSTTKTYTRYTVDGVDVDPATIREVVQKDAMTTSSLGGATTVNTAIRRKLSRKEKLQLLAKMRRQLSEMYLEVKFGPVYKANFQANKKYEDALARDLKRLYRLVLKKVGPISHWVEVAQTLHPVQKRRFLKRLNKAVTVDQLSVRDQLLAQIQQTVSDVDSDPDFADVYDSLDDDTAQAGNQGAVLGMLALGAGIGTAGLLGSGTADASTSDITDAFQDQLPSVADDAKKTINGTVDTLLASIASISAQIDAGEEADDDLNDLVDSKSSSVAGDVLAGILGATMLATFVSNDVDEKRWITMDDDKVCEDCLSNSQDGWISVDDTFSTGDDAPPAHPNCRCSMANKGGNTDDIQPPDEGD